MFDWKAFLDQWKKASQDSDKPASGEPGATEAEIAALETRIGRKLPPSYRAFLAKSNGWHPPGYLINRLRPAGEVDWFAKENQLLIDAYTRPNLASNYDPIHQLQATLQISDRSDSAVLLLNPNVIDQESGEWEAWFFAQVNTGQEELHRSFLELMQFKYRYLLQMEGGRKQAENERQQRMTPQRLLHGLGRFIERILTFPLYVVLYIMEFRNHIAFRLDKRFGTDLMTPKISIEEVEYLVDANLPATPNISHVLSFLESHKLRHSGQVYEDLRWHSWKELNELPSNLGNKRESIRKYMGAWIDNVGRDWLVTYHIRIVFYFDERDSLVTYVVDSAATGL